MRRHLVGGIYVVQAMKKWRGLARMRRRVDQEAAWPSTFSDSRMVLSFARH